MNKKQISSNKAVANHSEAMESGDHSNGASPKSQMSRGNITKILLFALALVVVSGACKKDPPEEPEIPTTIMPELIKERYIATPVAGDYRVDFSCSYSSRHKSSYEGYNVYYVYLGKIDMVPISAKTAQHHDGVGTTEFTYSVAEMNESTISKSEATTISNTVQEGSTHNNVAKIEASMSIGAPGNLLKNLFSFNIKAGYEHSWGSSTTTTEQTSRESTYTTVERWSKTETETIKRTIDDRYPVGYYRYALFATCDVYVEVLHDIEEDKWYYEYSVFARPNTLSRALDYSTTAEFNIGIDAVKLKFNPSIIEILSGIIPEVNIGLEDDASDPNRRYIDENGALRTVPSSITIENYTGQTTLGTAGATTWVLVKGTQIVNKRITIIGDVHIILTDNCIFTVSEGINVSDGDEVTIYSQSLGANMGVLTAIGINGNAGIGGNANQSGGSITINGGAITAHGSTGTKGGGGSGGGTSGGAGGRGAGAGIGGGGGNGGSGGAAVGVKGGNGSSGGGADFITINGGVIIAYLGVAGDGGSGNGCGGAGGGGRSACIGGGGGGGGGGGFAASGATGSSSGKVGNNGNFIGTGGSGGSGGKGGKWGVWPLEIEGTDGGTGGSAGGAGTLIINRTGNRVVTETTSANPVRIEVTYE